MHNWSPKIRGNAVAEKKKKSYLRNNSPNFSEFHGRYIPRD